CALPISCGSAGQAPDHEFLTVVEVLGYWELDRGAMASAGDRLCAGHDRDEPTASTGALVLGDDSLEGEGGGGGVGHDVFLSVVVVGNNDTRCCQCCQACRSRTRTGTCATAADGSVEFAQFGEQFACSTARVHLLIAYLALVRVNVLVRSDYCHIPALARGRLGQSQFILAAVPVLRAGRVEFIPHGLNLHVSAGQSVGGDVAVLERDVRHDVFLSVVVDVTSI